jgi:hypothetical protein
LIVVTANFFHQFVFTSQTIYRLLDWNKRLPSPVVQTELRVAFADALLKPWGRQIPADAIKGVLIEFFVRVLIY